MAPRKRALENSTADPVVKRRSARRAAKAVDVDTGTPNGQHDRGEQAASKNGETQDSTENKTKSKSRAGRETNPRSRGTPPTTSTTTTTTTRATSEDPDVDSLPDINPEAPRHDGPWYWLMKAEPETRFENGIDVKFSIDDLRSRKKPEGWDGIRAYAARNNMRNMNVGDKAFFYHSNCKEPGIVGIMEIVKEFSEDKSARRPGTPYYDPQSTRENPRWSLVHVEFCKKFAVPIYLAELRELGQDGGPLAGMQMLKQSRLSVTRVSAGEWEALCEIADRKAEEAGVEHITTRL